MNKEQASELITNTFNSGFELSKYRNFIINLLDGIDTESPKAKFDCSESYIKDSFRPYISAYGRIGKYIDKQGNKIEPLWVKLKKCDSISRARTMQRNFIAWYLNGGRGGKLRDNAIVAFFSEDNRSDWRFSFVKLDTIFKDFKVGVDFTPPKRYSFLVGKNEPNHTAKSRLVGLLEKNNPTVKEIEAAFNIETVSKEFFTHYKELFLVLLENLQAMRKKDPILNLSIVDINNADFCKKLMGQLVFLYFIQKKGWLGVKKNDAWGNGDKAFLRHTFERAVSEGKNFFNDYLEPLFYNALANGERDDNWFELLDCKIPFLNGGLFEPIYDWVNTDIVFDNSIFYNKEKSVEGDFGTGILDVFDRYNFTVKEDEPLEKEVAVDPEMLGKVFENLLEVNDRKSKGAFYTPREIVHYMCQESLINYLCSKLGAVDSDSDKFEIPEKQKTLDIDEQQSLRSPISHDDISVFIRNSDKILQAGLGTKGSGQSILRRDVSVLKPLAKEIDKYLENIKICDPAIGSGAFPVGMLNEIVKARIALVEGGFLREAKKRSIYEYKRQAIQNSIYGVDIEPGAIDIAKLRLWLSLVVDEEDFQNIKPLPNLNYKIVCGNSLLKVEKDLFNQELFRDLEALKDEYFNETLKGKKSELSKKIDKAILDLKQNNKDAFDFEIFFSEVFHTNGGFDVIIGNPPYVSNKKISQEKKDLYIELYGISDDLYNYFFIKGVSLLKGKGVLAFITSDTYLTINSKKNLRILFQQNRIRELIKTSNIFENAMVSPAILILQRENTIGEDYSFLYKNAIDDFNNPIVCKPNISLFRNVLNNVFFYPTDDNIIFYNKYNKIIKELYNKWWNKIETSKKISKNARELEEYRKNLKPGEITLLGCITDGGQGLATANNGKYLAVRKSTKWAKNIQLSRPKKLKEAIDTYKIHELADIKDAQAYLNGMSEIEIATLFDNLKEKYGRDIFGQGYIYKIIDDNEIADVDSLSDEEKENGISPDKKYYVPYDKGDKDGNRWYLETPFAIAWTKENVRFLKTDPKARFQGYLFYFKEGFCWSDINTTFLKCRKKNKSIHDVKSMSLFSKIDSVPEYYIISLINSSFISFYVSDFLNNTQTFQINDARMLPIIVPSTEDLFHFKRIFDEAYKNQKLRQKQIGNTTKENNPNLDIQIELDRKVRLLYCC